MFRNFPKNFYKQKFFQRSYIAAEKLLNTACLPEDFRKVRSLFKCVQIEDFSKKTSSLKASYTQKVFHTEPIFQNTNKRSIFIYLPTGALKRRFFRGLQKGFKDFLRHYKKFLKMSWNSLLHTEDLPKFFLFTEVLSDVFYWKKFLPKFFYFQKTFYKFSVNRLLRT